MMMRPGDGESVTTKWGTSGSEEQDPESCTKLDGAHVNGSTEEKNGENCEVPEVQIKQTSTEEGTGMNGSDKSHTVVEDVNGEAEVTDEPMETNKFVLVNSDQTVIPGNNGQTVIPGNNGQTVIPGNNDQTVISINNDQTVIPGNNGQTVIPDNNRQTATPDNNRQTATPDINSQTVAVIPVNNGQTSIPVNNGQSDCPSLTDISGLQQTKKSSENVSSPDSTSAQSSNLNDKVVAQDESTLGDEKSKELESELNVSDANDVVQKSDPCGAEIKTASERKEDGEIKLNQGTEVENQEARTSPVKEVEEMEIDSTTQMHENKSAPEGKKQDFSSVSGKIVESTDEFIIVQNSDSDDSETEMETGELSKSTNSEDAVDQKEKNGSTLQDLVEETVGQMAAQESPSAQKTDTPPASVSPSGGGSPSASQASAPRANGSPTPTSVTSKSAGPLFKALTSAGAAPPLSSLKTSDQKQTPAVKEPDFYGEAPKSMVGLVGAFLFNIGLDLVKEKTYKSLARVQTKRLKEDKLEEKEQEELEKMKKEHSVLLEKNESLHHKNLKCSKCNFKTESQNVLEHHMEYPHMEADKMTCSFCDFHSRQPIAFTYHMKGNHNKNARFFPRPLFHQCTLCFYEQNHKNRLMQHEIGCRRRFDIAKNLAPTNNFLHHSLSVEVKRPPPPKPKPAPPVSLLPGNKPNATQQNRMPGLQPGLSPSQHLAGMQTFNLNGQIYVWTSVGLVPMHAATQAIQSSRPISSIVGHPKQTTAPPTPVQMYAAQPDGPKLSPGLSAISQILKRSGSSVDVNGPTAPKVSKKDYEVCELCDGFVMNRDALRVHFYYAHQINMSPDIFQKYKSPPLTCAVCMATFWTSQGWNRHSKTHFQNECFICKKSFQQLVTHLETAHGLNFLNLVEINRCVSCGKTFTCEKDLESHMAKYHGLSLQPMKMVAEVRTAAVARDRIEKTPTFANLPASRKRAVPKGKPTTTPRVMTQNTLYECKTCGISNFSNVQEYYTHFGEKHGGLGCRHCSVKFNSLDELGYHLFLAHKEKLFMCNKCGFGALSTTALKQHMLDLHEKVRCNLCGRCYEGKAYKIHLMGHTKKCHVRIERLSHRVLEKYGISGLSRETDVIEVNAVIKDNGSIPRNDVALEDDVVVVE